MEETSNGKIEETKKVELPEQDIKAVIIEKVQDHNPEVILERERNSESIKETPGENDSGLDHSSKSKEETEIKEKKTQLETAGVLEEVLENSVVESAEVIVPDEEELTASLETNTILEKLENSDVVEAEEKVIEVTISPSSNEIPPVVTDWADGDGSSAVVTDAEYAASIGTEEKTLQSVDENVEIPPVSTEQASKGVEGAKVAGLEEKTGESSSVSVDKEAPGNVESTAEVGSSDAFPESTRNTPIVPLGQRVQSTSWRSCCGLFEALGRSNR